jgi:protein TonB
VALASLKFKRAQKPDYPEQSRSRNESGVVAVLVVVDAEGRVGEARIKQSCGHALLDDAALKAARRSRFHPYVEDGVHKTVVTVIPYHFNLHAAR